MLFVSGCESGDMNGINAKETGDYSSSFDPTFSKSESSQIQKLLSVASNVIVNNSCGNNLSVSIDAGESRELFLGEVLVHGNHLTKATHHCSLELESGVPINIIGIETSCGCSNVALSSSEIKPGEKCEVEFEFTLDPRFSVPRKPVTASVILDQSRSIRFLVDLVIFPTVAVAESKPGLSTQDAGEITFRTDATSKKFIAVLPINFYATSRDGEFNVGSTELPVSLYNSQPPQLNVSLTKSSNRKIESRFEETEQVVVCYPLEILINGTTEQFSSNSMNCVFQLQDHEGNLHTISASLREECEVSILPLSIVLRKSENSARIELVANHPASKIKVVDIEFDREILNVETNQKLPHDEDTSYTVSMIKNPDKKFTKLVVVFRLENGQVLVLDVFCIGNL